mmetsp:Transcript_87734/g.272576  ORF Transcript_87734/g.272576 Transcript_87734/m.272576 type:complete len:525 (+) Transcript_87734:765-2339(+)
MRTVAGCCAAFPVLPLAPLAVDAVLAAGVRVARRRLALHQRLASRATVRGRRSHCAAPAHEASSAGRGTHGPVVPLAPLAVRVGAHAVLADARQRLLQSPLAPLAELCLRRQQLPRAPHAAFAAVRGAGGPAGPVRELAHGVARVRVARLQLPEGAVGAAAAVARRRLHEARPEGLPALALPAAGRRVRLLPTQGLPLTPLREPAGLRRRRWAALSLLERLVAAHPGACGSLLHPAQAEALRVALRVAHGPVVPVAQDAVAAAALLQRAGLGLQRPAHASVAAVLRLAHHATHARVPSAAAGGAASSPLLPVGENAGHRRWPLAAGHRLLGAAGAGGATVCGLCQDLALAVYLASHRLALAPLGPLRQGAVDLFQQALVWHMLHGLDFGAAAGLAALIVGDADAPLAEFQARAAAEGVIPVPPITELAVHGRALLALWQVWAEAPHLVEAAAGTAAGLPLGDRLWAGRGGGTGCCGEPRAHEQCKAAQGLLGGTARIGHPSSVVHLRRSASKGTGMGFLQAWVG